eukprot:CAMPEP_0183352262 /NCGR_PEP_ID=MMETSP0164_2-20130417/28852_1 /TAXON_ID=221442 /ORGANISM="Coccolithus pelagicus ssp braarudi, Strain PLY182g" /LENGTH=182 /DNA_ID=CAMNT_0025524655 /DNA_START=54 /DNA_END=602 /DNA_ORIENTATION=+
MGTNNPSEEQLDLVTNRIIEIAETCIEPGLPIEADSYFEEHGFDLESASVQLTAKLKLYCKDTEGIEPTVEEHPQVRRMARYLLENVDYDILEKKLSQEVLKPAGKAMSTGGGLGERGIYFYGAVVLAVLVIALLLFFMLGGSSTPIDTGTVVDAAAAGHHAAGRGGRGGRGWRNGSTASSP